MSKFEKLLDLLVNEQKDEAEKVFHEIVVEKSRQIYEGILAEEEETSEADESSDNAEGDEVDEAKHKMKSKKDEKEMNEDEAEEEVEETEEPAESTDETIEEIGGDATDDLISDIEAEAEGMDDMEMPGEEGDDEGEEGDEAEEMFEPLEKELDALKAEFAKMMDDDKEDAPEESFAESKDADTIVKEYAEEVKKGLSASSESGADQTHSPVSKGGKSYTSAGAHKIGDGAEEKGGVGKALSGDTAKDMGVHAKNEGGIKSAKLEKAPAPMTKEANADKSSPVAKK